MRVARLPDQEPSPCTKASEVAGTSEPLRTTVGVTKQPYGRATGQRRHDKAMTLLRCPPPRLPLCSPVPSAAARPSLSASASSRAARSNPDFLRASKYRPTAVQTSVSPGRCEPSEAKLGVLADGLVNVNRTHACHEARSHRCANLHPVARRQLDDIVRRLLICCLRAAVACRPRCQATLSCSTAAARGAARVPPRASCPTNRRAFARTYCSPSAPAPQPRRAATGGADLSGRVSEVEWER